MTHQLVKNHEKTFLKPAERARTMDFNMFVQDITTKFLAEHGDELFPDQYFMRGPVDAFGENEDVIVEAQIRRLQVRLTFPENINEETQETIDDVLKNILIKELYAELSAEVTRLNEQGQIMCPYVLVATTGVIMDPINYFPVVGFITQYGTCPKPN